MTIQPTQARLMEEEAFKIAEMDAERVKNALVMAMLDAAIETKVEVLDGHMTAKIRDRIEMGFMKRQLGGLAAACQVMKDVESADLSQDEGGAYESSPELKRKQETRIEMWGEYAERLEPVEPAPLRAAA